jgi:hypothetical protein
VSAGLQSVLGRVLGRTPTTDAELKAMAAAVWHETGFICLRADWVQGWADKELAAAIATKVHGKRRVGRN